MWIFKKFKVIDRFVAGLIIFEKSFIFIPNKIYVKKVINNYLLCIDVNI